MNPNWSKQFAFRMKRDQEIAEIIEEYARGYTYKQIRKNREWLSSQYLSYIIINYINPDLRRGSSFKRKKRND